MQAGKSELATVNDSDIFLVGIMPSPRDMDIARMLGWYRIPLRFAPKLLDVDYLAFYQTASFGAKCRWRIETIAQLRGHELCKRSELIRDEPDHARADEEYYRLQIGPLQRLEQPILAGKWKRITFFYTLGRLIKRAEKIEELLVLANERELIWQSLRERAAEGRRYQAADQMDIPPELFSFLAIENRKLIGQTSELEQEY